MQLQAKLDLTNKRQRHLNSPVEKVFLIGGLKMALLSAFWDQKQLVQLPAVDNTWFDFCTKERSIATRQQKTYQQVQPFQLWLCINFGLYKQVVWLCFKSRC
mmetsp:Transcript_47184/g.92871  ORF Transcript_47184/g.92871 Transcript_47184/m.92871 type:complete len:102 (-) Transcript_47184:197-502(-)